MLLVSIQNLLILVKGKARALRLMTQTSGSIPCVSYPSMLLLLLPHHLLPPFQLMLLPLIFIITFRQLFLFLNMDSNSNSNILSHYSKSQKSHQIENDPAKRYLALNKHQRQIEREKAHKKDMQKKKRQQRKIQKRLIHNIAEKRQELLQLQQQKQRGTLQVVSQAEYRAKVHKETHNIKKMEKKLQLEIFQKDVQERAKQALKWQEKQRRQMNYKQHQAEYFRTIVCKSEKRQRKDAVRKAKSMVHRQQRQKRQQKEQVKRQMQKYVKGLGTHGLHKKLPNGKSQPHIIICKQNEEENQAMKNAAEVKKKVEYTQVQKQQRNAKNRQKAVERGNKAWQKIKRERQYQNYCNQVEQQQINYNAQRIAAGKKNQYTGVKPMTLSQIQLNKKLRGEQQFQKTFFKGKKLTNSHQVASKYTIFQNKMKEVHIQNPKQKPKKKAPINYADEQSRYNNVSEGRYSFEEDRQWVHIQPKQDKFQEKKQEYDVQYNNPVENYPRPIMKQTHAGETKNQMKETRAPQATIRNQLNYSQSQQQSINEP